MSCRRWRISSEDPSGRGRELSAILDRASCIPRDALKRFALLRRVTENQGDGAVFRRNRRARFTG